MRSRHKQGEIVKNQLLVTPAIICIAITSLTGCANGSAAQSLSTAKPSQTPVLTKAEKQAVESASTEAVQNAYYDCFPAVAAGVTITQFVIGSPSFSSGNFVQYYIPDEKSVGDGKVTIVAGPKVLSFQTTHQSDGTYTVVPIDNETIEALAASECYPH